MPQPANVVAVYGTLRYGASANGLMKGCKYLGKDKVSGRLFNLGSYPGLLMSDNPSDAKVIVDLYEIPDNVVLTSLDRYEGYYKDDPAHSLYLRKQTVTESGQQVQIYEYNSSRVPSNSLIETGDWFDEA